MKLINDDLRKKIIGLKSEPSFIDIEKGMIRKFAEAIADPNPLWQDEDFAMRSRFGGIIAPAGLFHAVMMRGKVPDLPPEIPLKRRLDGGGDWEYFRLVKAGERLSAVTRVADLQEREGKQGNMLFVTYETEWRDGKGGLAAKGHFVLILR